MKKDFITVSPDSGQGDASVNITADPNFGINKRSLRLFTKTTDGTSGILNVFQEGVPFYTSGIFKYSIYPNRIGSLDFIPTLRFMSFGTNDKDESRYPIYNYGVKKNDSNYDFSSDIKYFLVVLIKPELIEGYELELETPNNSVYLTKRATQLQNSDLYEGEIFLSNGTGIVDEMSLRLTNKNDAYDYRTLYQLVFN